MPVTATLTDQAGNSSPTSAPFNFTLDRGAPAKPSIASVPENAGGGINAAEASDGTTVNVALPTGTQSGDRINLSVGGVLVNYLVTAADITAGVSAIPVSSSALASAVSPSGQGSVDITATITDASGNTGVASDPFAINVDIDGPSAPTITAVPENSGGGINTTEAGDGTSVDVSIAGTGAIAGDVLTMNWGGASVVYSLTATDISNGSAAVPVSASTIATRGTGVFDITTTLTDSAGNASPPSLPFTVKVDVTPPFAPTITAIPENDNGGVNATEALDGTNVLISLAGSDADAGDTVNITWNGQPVAYILTPADITAGNATIPVSSVVITAGGDGTFPVIIASITDGAGNAGPVSVPFSVTVDTSVPAAPVIASIPESAGGIGRAEAADGIVVNVTLPSGAVTGDTVSVNFGGQIITYTLLASDIGSNNAAVFVSTGNLGNRRRRSDGNGEQRAGHGDGDRSSGEHQRGEHELSGQYRFHCAGGAHCARSRDGERQRRQHVGQSHQRYDADHQRRCGGSRCDRYVIRQRWHDDTWHHDRRWLG